MRALTRVGGKCLLQTLNRLEGSRTTSWAKFPFNAEKTHITHFHFTLRMHVTQSWAETGQGTNVHVVTTWNVNVLFTSQPMFGMSIYKYQFT